MSVGDDVEFDLVLRGQRVVVAERFAALEIGVSDGIIATIEPLGSGLRAGREVNLEADQVLIPGLVDTHVHVNEPGRTAWEGFASATRAAAAGGVTTIVDMPLNSIPSTVSVAALDAKRAAAEGKCVVDVGFWGGAIPGSENEFEGLVQEGVFGFKCFLVHSGVDEFPPLTSDELEQHLRRLVELGATMVVHAEDPVRLGDAPEADGPKYEDFLRSRPGQAEYDAISTVIECSRRTGARVHILHLSAADALPLIAEAKADGVPLSVETCPHYLVFEAEEIADKQTAFKCCPPIREASNRDALWQALETGLIDCVVTDHSPSTIDLKDLASGDFGLAWGGIASLQLGLSAVWTEARRRGIPLERVVSWMSARPAQLFGLSGKGSIEVGSQADFAVFEPESSFTVEAERLFHKNPLTPYEGRSLYGRVVSSYLRGEQIDAEHPHGEFLRKID